MIREIVCAHNTHTHAIRRDTISIGKFAYEADIVFQSPSTAYCFTILNSSKSKCRHASEIANETKEEKKKKKK